MSLSAALSTASSPHDAGIAEAAALSGRLTYVCMCLTLCWGVLAAAGWVRRFSGQDAVRSGHVVLAAFTLATGALHGLTFLLLDDFVDDGAFGFADLLLPFYDGTTRHALGIAGFELVVAVSVTAGLRRGAREGRWLRFHQFGYLAIGLLAVHAWLGAISSGHLAVVWLAGITAGVPPVVLSVLRLLPAAALVRAGLIAPAPVLEDGSSALRISVDSHRCHSYGVCQSEAPQVFRLGHDGQLEYEKRPEARLTPHVRAAARACPMRAIHLLGATR
ncbi:4Fe-4S domain-containing protein [Amycolatopsis sp. NPDC088138]|uniref:4Fe-4S domain-containing protein n=1 Tax=Amycolatopsis sp. NPDC088138 TaxID=3363938 RepID=UPI00381A7CEC